MFLKTVALRSYVLDNISAEVNQLNPLLRYWNICLNTPVRSSMFLALFRLLHLYNPLEDDLPLPTEAHTVVVAAAVAAVAVPMLSSLLSSHFPTL